MRYSLVRKHGTARDLADHAVGYTASGASAFSRAAAHSKPNLSSVQPKRPRTIGEMIQQNATRMGRLQAQLKTETDVALRQLILKELHDRSDLQSNLETAQRSNRNAP